MAIKKKVKKAKAAVKRVAARVKRKVVGGASKSIPFGRSLLSEFDSEMVTTRKVLERVPTEKGEWKPHPKSFSLGHLAQLVSGMPGWITNAVREPDLDLGKASGYSYEKTETLLSIFDKNVTAARAALAGAKESDFDVSWSLKMNGRTLFSDARRNIVRQHINHLVHHRAQLGVYLRLLDIPVPQMYGPTADEKWAGLPSDR